ncbi:hypothetical protein Csa_013493 [Cucumis sativus]|uniref:Uncharacterized protein n=1 Tax=Cucumis sativus TaxID=3659 RepID=A0A0A0LQM3_CUCSA|nr:hypothetical protein Csa_013493 [Cucumis sativus]
MGRIHVVISGEGFTSCTVREKRRFWVSVGFKLQVEAPISHSHHLQVAVILAPLLQFLAGVAVVIAVSVSVSLCNFLQNFVSISYSTFLSQLLCFAFCYYPRTLPSPT